jgi:hypothetical protein
MKKIGIGGDISEPPEPLATTRPRPPIIKIPDPILASPGDTPSTPAPAISLDAIYQPLNKFFMQKFGQGDGASIFFRFAKIPVKFYDSDFVNPQHPEWGPSPAMAVEQFSNVVDKVTWLDPNEHGVWLYPLLISDLYHDEILGPSLPFIPAGAGAATTQVVIDAFSQIKGDAGKRWENCRALSLITPGTWVRPSSAKPQDWWNKADPDLWSPAAFPIQGATTVTPGQPPNQLLKLKISDSVLRPILLSHVNPVAAPLTSHVVPATDRTPSSQPATLSHPTGMMVQPIFAAMLAGAATAPQPRVAMLRPTTEAGTAVTAPSAPSVAMHTELMARASALPVSQRIELQFMLSQSAPTQTVGVTDVTISFEYCLVNVDRRDWIHSAFLNNKSWFIPGQPKGSLSANDGHGVPALPVGFIAFKKLRITAPWTPADIANIELSDQFGPFLIDSNVVDGAIGHEGMQVVGWILQDMPDLPPVGDPTLNLHTP